MKRVAARSQTFLASPRPVTGTFTEADCVYQKIAPGSSRRTIDESLEAMAASAEITRRVGYSCGEISAQGPHLVAHKNCIRPLPAARGVESMMWKSFSSLHRPRPIRIDLKEVKCVTSDSVNF